MYSDRANNNAYLDNLGLKQGQQQPFLTPYFVIDETSDFLELVKFDPSQLGKPKGIFSFFYGNTYNFKDIKNVEYVGWMQKSKLLHFSHSKVSKANLKPLVYFLGAHTTETLLNLRRYIKKDTVNTFVDPDLTMKAKTSFNTNQLVYLYKYNATKTAALISNVAHIQGSNSSTRVMGWVPSQLIKNIGQQKVWKVNGDKSLVFMNSDTTKKYTIQSKTIKDGFIFQPEERCQQNKNTIKPFSMISNTPIHVWDHYTNKLMNVKGGDIPLKDISTIKKQNNTFNIHFIFDCSEDLKEKLLLQIPSLQRIWLLISEDDRYKDFTFTFSASSYGCDKYYEFPKSKSFALWIDYLQNVFLNTPDIAVKNHNYRGIERCLVNFINTQPEGNDFENNIMLIMGNDSSGLDLDLDSDDDVLYDLAKLPVRLLFFQLENTTSKKHQDFVLQAKQILDNIGNQYSEYVTDYIIENKQLLKKNLFIALDSKDNNIYLYDAPNRSMYTGGIVFPKINHTLNPTSFDIAVDSLLSKTVASTTRLIASLEHGVRKLGFLRSKPSRRIVELFKKDSIKALLIPKINKNEMYLETSVISLKDTKHLASGYLFSKKQLTMLIESYKSIIPLLHKTVKRKDRRVLYKKYKSYYKQLNKLLFYKQLKRRNTIAALLKVKTGISVHHPLLHTLKIPYIKRKSKLSNNAYSTLMKFLRSKISYLENVVENQSTKTFVDGSNKTYYYIAENKLL